MQIRRAVANMFWMRRGWRGAPDQDHLEVITNGA